MRDALADTVGRLMRRAAADSILPRFRALKAGDVEEKSPGEIVTAADRETEIFLSRELCALLPGSAVLGEEAASLNPGLRGILSSHPRIWLIDPLDGTANFVAGKNCFSVMVGLVEDGQTVASWMLDPLADSMAFAELGGGAHMDGHRIHASRDSPVAQDLRGAVLPRFLPENMKARIAERRSLFADILPGLLCAGHEYPAIASGTEHFALFWRTDPWDHAPGALFLTEAGGVAARLDGTPYVPAGDLQGLLVAQNPRTWHTVAHALSLGS